jgi:hypothetical protein
LLCHQTPCFTAARAIPFFGDTKRVCRTVSICDSPRKATSPNHPHLMTEAVRDSNGTASSDMTASRDVGQGKEAATINAPKSSSPSRDKRSSGPDSEAPTKSSKKRRKVNHGMASMSCTRIGLFSPANSISSSSVHILQTFGEPQPPSPASNTWHYIASLLTQSHLAYDL